MKRFAALSAVLLSLAFNAAAQSSDEAAVAAAMDELGRAIVAVDEAKLKSLLAPEVSYGHSGGRIEDQSQMIGALTSKKSVYKTFEQSKQTVRIVGDVAIVRNHLSSDIVPAGKPDHVELEILYIWQKRGGEWKLLARQAVKI
jgi:hypothetical protein